MDQRQEGETNRDAGKEDDSEAEARSICEARELRFEPGKAMERELPAGGEVAEEEGKDDDDAFDSDVSRQGVKVHRGEDSIG
jgi:hypothetical protein